jgi:hypothetical protein
MSTSYFIPGLSSSHARMLDEAACCTYAIVHGAENGLVVAESDIQKAMQVLRARPGASSASRFFQGIVRLELEFGGSAAHSTASAGNGSSLSALNAVLAQVAKLQDQANLSDAERIERLRLQDQVRSKQGDLEAAMQRLQSASSICAQTESRIQAISAIASALSGEMAALPAELQTQCGGVTAELDSLAGKLGELAASCHADQTAALAEVEAKKVDLQGAKDALSADISKRRVSAEDAISAAEAALLEAEKIAEGNK